MPMNTNFEQLRKQELELRKLLKELDTLPQTPQIELQKQEIQTYIDKITPSILSGFNQKFKEITKNSPNK
ncbi:replication initiation protein, partial [Helicobacter pylori]|nr:replication initiation protein [Helicobacter pylori]